MNTLRLLASWLAGSFRSRQEVRTQKKHHDTWLYMLPIWPHRADGLWFYVEQGDEQDKPYRQRVYHLTKLSAEMFENKIYTINKPARFVGGWHTPEKLAALSEDILTVRESCSIIFRKINPESFAGSTVGEGCLNDWGGALYATSQLVITKDQIISWVRGYNDQGSQIWGATKGGHIFRKMKAYPLE